MTAEDIGYGQEGARVSVAVRDASIRLATSSAANGQIWWPKCPSLLSDGRCDADEVTYPSHST